jgi:hypothetical protein
MSVRRIILAGAVVLATGAAIRPASNLSGPWSFDMDPDPRGNRGVIECAVQQRGDVLSVKCGGTGIEMTGSVHGQKASWRSPPMTKDRLVMSYTADTNADGTRMEGNWTLTGGVLNERGAFHATKRQ